MNSLGRNFLHKFFSKKSHLLFIVIKRKPSRCHLVQEVEKASMQQYPQDHPESLFDKFPPLVKLNGMQHADGGRLHQSAPDCTGERRSLVHKSTNPPSRLLGSKLHRNSCQGFHLRGEREDFAEIAVAARS